jgi:outer membrane protein assembly factor BamB/predicted phosphodiesterase
MKRLIFFLAICSFTISYGQSRPFRFAFISDTHIGSPNGGAEEDLRRTVADINSMSDIAFVVITGDITELGTDKQLLLAKQILDSLNVKYYIIPGNHDTGWSESGGLSFTKVFGYDKFFFQFMGINFIGCASGPYVRMSDGHVPRDAMNWMKEKINSIGKDEPIVFLNHYPLDNGLDNWYEVIDLLKTKNTILVLCGHGHNNRPVKAEDIPSVMGRSNLRAKAPEGGYNLVELRSDSILFTERKPFSRSENLWTSVVNEKHVYEKHKNFPRPDFSINDSSRDAVSAKWIYQSEANVISTPAIVDGLVVYGNQNGKIEALQVSDGKLKWNFKTEGPIFSSPAVSKEKIVIGSADGNIYCLDSKGKLLWKFKSEASVLGSPLIENDRVFIGGSDHHFYAIDLNSGKALWKFDGLNGPVVSQPVIAGDRIIFGAWDQHLYALDKNNGALLWKWSNGSTVINYSPAACIPVIKNGVVYIVAPDRYLSAIDLSSGKTLWRTNQSAVRESIGISNDGQLVYGKTMQDTVVAFYTDPEKPLLAWKLFAGYGYEHAPSMLIEKDGIIFFGTRNGVVYAIDAGSQKKRWAYKIDNSMVNTVRVLNSKQLIASTMDGKICLLKAR